jgi:hypothetical protein
VDTRQVCAGYGLSQVSQTQVFKSFLSHL